MRDARECAREGCARKIKAAGLCQQHYNRKRLEGVGCKVDGCRRPVLAKGWCSMHYHRVRTNGQPGEVGSRGKAEKPCLVDGCRNLAVTRERLCPTHRNRKRLYGTVDGTFATHKKCVECGDPAVYGPRSSDHCEGHYIALVKRMVASREVVGTVAPAGYAYVSIFKKRYAEHAIVMEHVLGRPLTKGESVHHKNGRRDDNRPENLELWVKPQPAGQRPEDLVAWVVNHYPDLVRAALAERG